MKSLGYLSAFLGGAIAGAALGILMAPEKGSDTRVKITDAVEDFMKKHNIKLSRKERKWSTWLTTSRMLPKKNKSIFNAVE